jgi:hypothetical protein
LDKLFLIQQNIYDKKKIQIFFSQNGENAPPKKSLGQICSNYAFMLVLY